MLNLHGVVWPVVGIVSQVGWYGWGLAETAVVGLPVEQGVEAGVFGQPDDDGQYQQQHEHDEERHHACTHAQGT